MPEVCGLRPTEAELVINLTGPESQESQSRSVVTPNLCAFSPALIGAELGAQAPLIQVLTPKRGSTHAWRMIQTTRTPTRISDFIDWLLCWLITTR